MIASAPIPFAEAIRLLLAKQLLPTSMNTEKLDGISATIRRQSMFSARVGNAAVLQEMSDRIGRIVEQSAGGGEPGSYMDAGKFREEMRAFLDSIGYVPPKPTGNQLVDELTDLTSQRRLDLIVKTNVSMARGYGQHVQSYSPAGLDAFPCQELFRLGQRKEPRNWPAIWKEKGGTLYGGRMIAEKGDAIWTDISRFGNPYPPFDFGSGMWVKDVPRAVAVRIGVISKSAKVKAKATPLKMKTQVGESFSTDIAAQLRASLAEALQMEGG